MTIDEILKKHADDFEQIAVELAEGKPFSEVADRYRHLTNEIGVGTLGLAAYVEGYVKIRKTENSRT